MLAGQGAGLHAQGSQMACLQGEELTCTLRGASLHACRARGWLARAEEPNCVLAGQGASLHAQGSWLACSGETRALSVPGSVPEWGASSPLGWHPAVTMGHPLLASSRSLPACQKPSLGPDSGLVGAGFRGGRSPRKVPGWVLGAGDVLRSRCRAPCALVNIEFVFLLQLCFSTHIALSALIPFLFFPWKYRQHPRGGYNLKYRCIMQIKPKPCPRVTGSDSFIPASPSALARARQLLQPD